MYIYIYMYDTKLVHIYINVILLFNLGIVGFCIVFGVILGNMGKQAQVMLDFFRCLSEMITRMVNLIMWYVLHLTLTAMMFYNSVYVKYTVVVDISNIHKIYMHTTYSWYDILEDVISI